MSFKKNKPGCSICLEEILKNNKELECTHCYHENCINKWLDKEGTCPLCRKRIDNNNDDDSYFILIYIISTIGPIMIYV